jgi:hypothetical protein
LRKVARLSLAYDTFARTSVVVAFNVGDIAHDVDGATVFIRASETDREDEGDYRFVSASTHRRIATWVNAARLEKWDPLFIPLRFAAKNDRLSAGDISTIIARRCGDRYTSHSTGVGQLRTR